MPTLKPTSKSKLFSTTKDFRERNEKFQAASAVERRVMIAQDVLDQVLAKKFVPETGVWAHVVAERGLADSEQVCDVIAALGTECTCCALGAMMLSEIGINDQLEIGETANYDSSFRIQLHSSGNRLEEYFDDDQLKLIEIAFELGAGEWDEFEVEDEFQGEKAIDFGYRHDSNTDRLVAIMNNIIKNNGTFIP